MKKLLIPLIAIFALSITATAQDQKGKMGKKGHHHQKQMMAKELNLSEAQQTQVKAINEDFRKKMQELNKQENITVKEMRERKAALIKEKKSKMDGLLTADQKTKQAQLKTERKVKNETHMAKRMDKMQTELNLTDAQVTKLKAQQSAMKAKAEQIRNNESLSMEQKKAQMMALKSEAKEQRKVILTADQLKKMEEMKKNRGGRGASKK